MFLSCLLTTVFINLFCGVTCGQVKKMLETERSGEAIVQLHIRPPH